MITVSETLAPYHTQEEHEEHAKNTNVALDVVLDVFFTDIACNILHYLYETPLGVCLYPYSDRLRSIRGGIRILGGYLYIFITHMR